MLSFILLLGACSITDQKEVFSTSTRNDIPSVSVSEPINNAPSNSETTAVDASQTMDEPPKISIGVVKIISGGKEYEPRIDGLYGLANGIHYDAIIMQPDDIADLLVPIPLGDDFQIVIDGGIRRGGTTFELYRLTDGEWVIISEKNGDIPEYSASTLDAGEYLLRITLTWQNGMDGDSLEYLGVTHSFKISV